MPGAPTRIASLPANLRVEFVQGHAAVLARLPELHAFLAGSPQQAELEDLPYFLARPRRIRHHPCLLILYGSATLAGAVVLFEFRSWLRGQRLYSCYSRRGRRTVLGPFEHRVEIAAIAAQHLLTRGARFINIEINQGPFDSNPIRRDLALQRALHQAAPRLQTPGVQAEWALHPGVKYFDLPLTADFQTTLDAMHQKTRKNLRYHQRKAIRELGVTFYPRLVLDRQAFLHLHQLCDYPVPPAVAAWRFDVLGAYPHTFLAGLQAADGQWLALAAGRRNRSELELDWQINRPHKIISITTAMRAFLIDHAIQTGAATFSLEGGTLTPSVLHSFRQHSVYNLAVRRNTFFLRLLERFLLSVYPGRYVTKALIKPWRLWHPIPTTIPPTQPSPSS